MANEVQSPPEAQSLTTLVTGILNDAQELTKQQLNLIRTEIQEDFRKTKEGALTLSIGAGIGYIGGVFLCLTVVYLLEWAAHPNLPLWACFAIVTGIILVVSAGLLVAGKKKFDSFNPLPDQSLQGLRENLQWKTNLK
jgi:high-affinity Fe2+/Pb2+ permease